MIDFIFNSIWGWVGTAGVIVAACAAFACIFPQFRATAVAIAGAALGAAAIYAKGSRDRATFEQRRRDKIVNRVEKRNAEIDARPDTPDTVDDRLRKHGNF